MNEQTAASGLFDSRIAALYDKNEAAMYKADVIGPTIDLLADLSREGRALEFASGTGRIALPLLERGIEVHGIELSQPMLDQMLQKPQANSIPVTIGDMSRAKVGDNFDLVYLVYNTITNLITQDEQVHCFCNAAAHLKPGGLFLIEVAIPQIQRLPAGERFTVFDMTASHIGFDEYDTSKQLLVSHHLWKENNQIETFDSVHRYAWPAEYDLMARIAGLSLLHRWSDWQRQPFTSDSAAHISVWQKP